MLLNRYMYQMSSSEKDIPVLSGRMARFATKERYFFRFSKILQFHGFRLEVDIR